VDNAAWHEVSFTSPAGSLQALQGMQQGVFRLAAMTSAVPVALWVVGGGGPLLGVQFAVCACVCASHVLFVRVLQVQLWYTTHISVGSCSSFCNVPCQAGRSLLHALPVVKLPSFWAHKWEHALVKLTTEHMLGRTFFGEQLRV
jgi:hypothetical protein